MAVQLKFTRSARRHRVGKARVVHALDNAYDSRPDDDHGGSDPRVFYLGKDQRGVELEIVVIHMSNVDLVIHAMPTHYRRRQRWFGV